MTWLGTWIGDSGDSGTPSSPALGIETNAAAIRDRIIAVIAGLAPTTMTSDAFRAFRNEREGTFQPWAEENPTACRRVFQVRRVDDSRNPELSNSDHEERMITFRVLVAYAQTNRDGMDGALDRDDAIDDDMLQIEHAIGMCGRVNLAPPYPDACWRQEGNGETSRITQPVEGKGVDLGQMFVSYSYLRTTT